MGLCRISGGINMIKLISGYYLDSDKYCYMVGKKQKVKNSKTGEEEIKFIL